LDRRYLSRKNKEKDSRELLPHFLQLGPLIIKLRNEIKGQKPIRR
jgi:hypothetical protein